MPGPVSRRWFEGPECGPPEADRLGDGEIETLYVLDDWREQGLGRRLMRAAARDLASRGCRSVFVWVLRDNPSRFFYRHLGGQAVAHGTTSVAGVSLAQTAFGWDPIDRLLAAEVGGVREAGVWGMASFPSGSGQSPASPSTQMIRMRMFRVNRTMNGLCFYC